jgi:aminopeptidase N
LQRWWLDGGESHQGFIVFYVREKIAEVQNRPIRQKDTSSPIFLTGEQSDYLIHELAHQWWGGAISWATYRDEWLTEGLAQFTILYYLQHEIAATKFQEIISRLKRWVLRYSNAGPLAYGQRIANIDQFDAYQSVVYDKAALIFLMAKEILGEEEFCRRLREVLHNNMFRNLNSAQFIQKYSLNSSLLEKFFHGWVFSRKTPAIHFSTVWQDGQLQVFFQQEDTDFVVPVRLEVEDETGWTSYPIVLEGQKQACTIKLPAPPLAVRVNPYISPVQVKERERF